MTQKSTCKYLPYLFTVHCCLAEILNLITDKREWLGYKMYDKRVAYQAYGVIFLYDTTLHKTIKSWTRISPILRTQLSKNPYSIQKFIKTVSYDINLWLIMILYYLYVIPRWWCPARLLINNLMTYLADKINENKPKDLGALAVRTENISHITYPRLYFHAKLSYRYAYLKNVTLTPYG